MVSPQVIVKTAFLTNAVFFLIDAKTSIGFMLAHYLNSEVFVHALK
jgi:hypothetical protein